MNLPGSSGSTAPSSPVPGHSRAAVVPHSPNWQQKFLARLIFLTERLVTLTLQFRWDDRSGLFGSSAGQPVIFCQWHNRLALSMTMYRRYPQRLHPGRRLAAMVSASRDGAFLASILEAFGVEPVRGSSSRRGPQALLELTSWAERGYDLAITPDGPRGPRYVVQDGVIALAQLTGLPIVTVTFHTRWKVCFRSWDRFQLPLPFARCQVSFGEAIRVGRDASDDLRESLRRQLEDQLRTDSRD